jgi:anaerobic ribonucleoside-triphosphate reductase activating protein
MPEVSPPTATPPGAFRAGGLVPFSTTDWPGRISAVVFAQGCPWRCRYCHNPHLCSVEGEVEQDFASVLVWLGTRKGLIDAVVFSGGEPTSQPALGAALDAVRALGFRTGLHTGGMYPRRLVQVLPKVDWVGIDVKAPQDEYEAITGVPRSGLSAFVSLALVRQFGVEHEVRTTIHPSLTPPDLLLRLARELANAGVARWVLQPFRAQGCEDDALTHAVPQCARVDDALLAQLRAIVPDVAVRG